MKAVDGLFEPFAHLDLVDHDDIPTAFDIALFYIRMQRVVFCQRFKFEQIEVDENDVSQGVD